MVEHSCRQYETDRPKLLVIYANGVVSPSGSYRSCWGFSTPQAIYKWQHGASLPTVDNLVALSIIFDVPIDAILVTGVVA